jgi:antitoxin component YwqK of YwqJK toxin-antitoxin module
MVRVPEKEIEYPGDGLYYLNGLPFTGTMVFLSGTGQERGESEYKNGLRWGLTKDIYPDGSPMVEATYFKGALHGRAREWHRGGQLAEDGEYEYGIALWKKRWNEAGLLEHDYKIDPSGDAAQRLQRARILYGSEK